MKSRLPPGLPDPGDIDKWAKGRKEVEKAYPYTPLAYMGPVATTRSDDLEKSEAYKKAKEIVENYVQ
jgi:hypothetical protein